MTSIQERFLSKTVLCWRAYGRLKRQKICLYKSSVCGVIIRYVSTSGRRKTERKFKY